MVESHYTTDEQYRAVASNHISHIRYNKVGLELLITFANGAKYQYLGVPLALYQGLMTSPSHGVFFWRNIRQRFPYNLIKNESDTITDSICPELKRLDALDLSENKIRKKYNKGELEEFEFNNLLNVINTKRHKLTLKLEKDGYYGQEIQASHSPPAMRTRQWVERPPNRGIDNDELEPSDNVIRGVVEVLAMMGKGFVVVFAVFFGLMAALMR